MATIPDLAEIVATVARMEAHYGALATTEATRFMAAYARVSGRFAADLADPRDLALARSAALMMVRELARGDAP